MTTTLSSVIQEYIASLPSTEQVCIDFGATFTFGTNLFVNIEPINDKCVFIIQYAGTSPRNDRYKYESRFQVGVKHTSRQAGEKTAQAFINLLHYNCKVVTKGLVQALTSTPIVLVDRDGGSKVIFVSNFNVKYIKL